MKILQDLLLLLILQSNSSLILLNCFNKPLEIKKNEIVSKYSVFKRLAVVIFPFLITALPIRSNALSNSNIVENTSLRQKVIRQTNELLSKSSILESIRILDQIEPDERIARDANKVLLILPIVSFSEDVQTTNSLLKNENDIEALLKIKTTLNQEKYSVKNLKKMFNQYADNIYYSDPERANLYLAGGSLPDSSQTEKYLLRNDILTKINDVKEDIDNLIISKTKSGSLVEQDLIDSQDDFREVINSLNQYFLLIDKNELSLARDVYNTNTSNN